MPYSLAIVLCFCNYFRCYFLLPNFSIAIWYHFGQKSPYLAVMLYFMHLFYLWLSFRYHFSWMWLSLRVFLCDFFCLLSLMSYCRCTFVFWLYVEDYCPTAPLCSILHHITWDDRMATPLFYINQKGISFWPVTSILGLIQTEYKLIWELIQHYYNDGCC